MPKGTPEDLIDAVIEADDLRRKTLGLPSTRAAKKIGLRYGLLERFFVEPFFNVLGLLWGQVMVLLPASMSRPFIQWVNVKMSGDPQGHPPDLARWIERAVEAAKRIKQETHQWPALLLLTSHPETEGPHQWLRFELLRQGLLVADAVVDAEYPGRLYPPRPKCFLAIDPFALDTVSSPVGAFYGAWMHRVYLAWDRQSSTQTWIQRHALLRHTDSAHISWRLLRELARDTPVLMALSGGLPYNARLLYAAREFVHHLPIKRWKMAKRSAQLELMDILMKPGAAGLPADKGELSFGNRQAIRAALVRWGVPSDQIDSALQELEDEFRLPIPYRARFFRVLTARLVKKGKPLLLVGIRHSDTAPHVRFSDPCEVQRDTDPQRLAKSFAQFFTRSL